MKRGWLTIVTVTGLFGAFRLYAAVVGPLTTPEASSSQELVPALASEIKPLSIVGRMARTHLVDEDWAADAKFQLQRGDETFIYFREQNRIEDDKQNKMRVSPFAMVWVDPRREDGAAYTISCKSAVIEFQSKLQFGMSSPGRIIAGQLDGAVRITGPEGLEIVGQNFQFSEESHRLHSDFPVRFAFGPQPEKFEQIRGRAGGVDVGLKQASEPLWGNDMPLVGGLKQVTLRRNVALDLVMDDHGRPAPVQLTCKTQFIYDVDQMLATFTEDVRVRRATNDTGDPEQFDWLQCEHLQLVFEEPATARQRLAGSVPVDEAIQVVSARSSQHDAEDRLGISLDLEFRSMQAIGHESDAGDGRGQLKAGSQENDLTARMEQLFYDASTRTVEMIHTSGSVEARYRSDELTCPTIRLRHNDDDKIETAECIGAGSVVRRDPATEEVLVESSWKEYLRLHPDEDSALDILEIVGEGRVIQPPQKTGIVADEINVWLDGETLQSSDGDLQTSMAASGAEGEPPIKRVVATSNVALVSPQLQLETQRLEADFVVGEVAAAADPLTHESTDQAGETEASRDDELPIVVAADAVVTQIVFDPKTEKTDINHLNATNGVTISRPVPAGEHSEADGNDPFSIVAEDLELQNHDGSHVLILTGSPARIWHPEAEIEGARLLLDRGANRARVEGKGALTTHVDTDLQGKKLDVREDLVVRWDRQMTFDGQRAVFFGNVRTTLADSNMLCQRMRVTLNRLLDFAADRPQQEQLDIDRIECQEGVTGQYTEWDGTTLIGIRKIDVAEFAFERVSGDVEAQGPGRIDDWQREGERRRFQLEPDANVQREKSASSAEYPWEYTGVKFAGRMTGNQRDGFMTLNDRVRVIHGPVKKTLDVIVLDDFLLDTHQAKNSIWIGCNTLQLRLVPGEADGPDTVNVLANGNAELQGKVIGARADSITYEEAKELFTLKGRGSDAYLWHQEYPGGPVREMMAKTFQFSPSKSESYIGEVRGIQGAQ